LFEISGFSGSLSRLALLRDAVDQRRHVDDRQEAAFMAVERGHEFGEMWVEMRRAGDAVLLLADDDVAGVVDQQRVIVAIMGDSDGQERRAGLA
jgi:hypothetical protein